MTNCQVINQKKTAKALGRSGGYERGEIQMFIWDFVADTVLGQIVDWSTHQNLGFPGDFYGDGKHGSWPFEMSWVQSIVLFFSYLAWAPMSDQAAFNVGRVSVRQRQHHGDTALTPSVAYGCGAVPSPYQSCMLSVFLQGSSLPGLSLQWIQLVKGA